MEIESLNGRETVNEIRDPLIKLKYKVDKKT